METTLKKQKFYIVKILLEDGTVLSTNPVYDYKETDKLSKNLFKYFGNENIKATTTQCYDLTDEEAIFLGIKNPTLRIEDDPNWEDSIVSKRTSKLLSNLKLLINRLTI